MLEVIQFDSGRYGLRNTWTGIVLIKKDGEVRTFRTVRGAKRKADRIAGGLNKTIRQLNRSHG